MVLRTGVLGNVKDGWLMVLKAGGYGGVGAWSRGVGWSRAGPVRVTRRYDQGLTHGHGDVT